MLTACARAASFVEGPGGRPGRQSANPRAPIPAAQAFEEHGQHVVGKLPGGQIAAGLRTHDVVCRDRVARYHPPWFPTYLYNDGSAGIQHHMATEQLPEVLGAWWLVVGSKRSSWLSCWS